MTSNLCKLRLTAAPKSGGRWFAFPFLVCMHSLVCIRLPGLHALSWSACAALVCMHSLVCMRLAGLHALPWSACAALVYMHSLVCMRLAGLHAPPWSALAGPACLHCQQAGGTFPELARVCKLDYNESDLLCVQDHGLRLLNEI